MIETQRKRRRESPMPCAIYPITRAPSSGTRLRRHSRKCGTRRSRPCRRPGCWARQRSLACCPPPPSFRLSTRLLEKALPPATAALVAATVYGMAAGAAGAAGIQRLRVIQPLFPAQTARETVKTVADTTARAAGG